MGRPKHELPLPDGRPMIDHVIDALAACCPQVIVVGGDAGGLVDRAPGLGPLGGIDALLASGLDEHYLVCPCDMPRVNPGLLGALLVETDADATVLHVEGEDAPRPLPLRIAAAALPIVEHRLESGERSLRGLLEVLDRAVVTVPAAMADVLHVHTAASADAYAFEVRGGPEEAYAFARGGRIELPGDRTLQLARPLDFAAVTDHAEWFDDLPLCTQPGSPLWEHEACLAYRGRPRPRHRPRRFTCSASSTSSPPRVVLRHYATRHPRPVRRHVSTPGRGCRPPRRVGMRPASSPPSPPMSGRRPIAASTCTAT